MNYQTKQREIILLYFKNHIDETIFPQKILKETKGEISKATLYRFIKDGINNGLIKKIFDSNTKSYGYQYLKNSSCNNHLHLKCIKCGKTIHLECDDAMNFIDHIENNHSFKIDESLTTIYGLCKECQKKRDE